MPKLSQFGREPRGTARARRNANRLATLVDSLVSGSGGIEFDSDGRFKILLDPASSNLLTLTSAGIAALEATIFAAIDEEIHAMALIRTLGS